MRFKLLVIQFVIFFPVLSKAETFGRLFTTPEQRTILDNTRHSQSGKMISTEPATEDLNTNPQLNNDIQLSGFILKEDGTSTVWINGQSNLSTTPKEDIKSSSPHRRTSEIQLRTHGKERILKPGQVWQLDNNQVQEAYQSDSSIINSTLNTDKK